MTEHAEYTYQGTVARVIAYEVLKLPHTCEVCGVTGKVEVHHINRDRTNNTRENLKILCHLHHLRAHGLFPKPDRIRPIIDDKTQSAIDARRQTLIDKRNAETAKYRQKYGITDQS